MSAAPALSSNIGCAHDADLPWVSLGEGIELKVLRVVEPAGLWVIRNRFAAGVQIPRHRHTGEVHGFTLQGCWHYIEYGIDYPAGSYIHEPANSVHTLRVPADNPGPTDILFVIQGANLNLDEEGKVWRVDDGPTTLAVYLEVCAQQGRGRPPVLLQ